MWFMQGRWACIKLFTPGAAPSVIPYHIWICHELTTGVYKKSSVSIFAHPGRPHFAACISTDLMGILLQPLPSHRSALQLAKWSLCTKFSLVLRALINNRSLSQGWKGRPQLTSKRKREKQLRKTDSNPSRVKISSFLLQTDANRSTKRGQSLPWDQFYNNWNAKVNIFFQRLL